MTGYGVSNLVGRACLCPTFFLREDDNFVFLKASLKEGKVLKEVLDLYKATSGQTVNMDKFEVCFGVFVAQNIRDDIAGLLKVKQVECHEKYLGLPTFAGRCKNDLFFFIKIWFWNKLKG